MSHIVQQVSPNYVVQVWPQVEGYFQKAMTHSAGEYNLDQLKGMLVAGTQALLVSSEDGKILGGCTIAFENYPNMRVAFITCIGGRLIAAKDDFEQVKHWCRAQGATAIRGAAFEAVARLWRQRFGCAEIYRIVEFKL